MSKERSRPLSLSLKRKMKPESEKARKKSTTPPTILTPNLLSIPTDSRNFHGMDASPLLDAEALSREAEKLQIELIVGFRLSDLDASQSSSPS